MFPATRRVLFVALAALLATVALSDAPAQVKKDAKAKETQKPKETPKTQPASGAVFEVYKDAGGSFRFRLKTGDTILAIASKGYESRDDCVKVVNDIKAEAARARVVDAPDGKAGGKK